MLIAHDAAGTRVPAGAARAGQRYICPTCGAACSVKQGLWRVAHFAHLPAVAPCPGSSETLIHLRMKLGLYAAFRRRPWVQQVELE